MAVVKTFRGSVIKSTRRLVDAVTGRVTIRLVLVGKRHRPGPQVTVSEEEYLRCTHTDYSPSSSGAGK